MTPQFGETVSCCSFSMNESFTFDKYWETPVSSLNFRVVGQPITGTNPAGFTFLPKRTRFQANACSA